MKIDSSQLVAFDHLPLEEVRRKLQRSDSVDIDLALRTFMQDCGGDRRLGRVLEVLLGPCARQADLSSEDVSRVSSAVSNLLWETAKDPTYGGNIRNFVKYYRSCNLESRGLLLQGLMQMLDVDQVREDARVIISGLPIFAGWENGPPDEGQREFGERLKGERVNPAAPRRKAHRGASHGK